MVSTDMVDKHLKVHNLYYILIGQGHLGQVFNCLNYTVKVAGNCMQYLYMGELRFLERPRANVLVDRFKNAIFVCVTAYPIKRREKEIHS